MALEKHFKIDPLDPLKLIKVNDLSEVKNPIAFARNNVPTSDGLLSNEIFGITKFDRSNTYAYISLGDWFMHPLHYKIWSKMDSSIKAIIHETDTFKIDSSGNLVKDPEGNTGIKWLKQNVDKIKIKSTESRKRDKNIQFLTNHRDTMFINNIIIIPAYYRDANTTSGKPGLSEINKLYQSLMMACRSLKENADYGFTLNGATRGRIQEQILLIYQWFSGSENSGFDNAVGIGKKSGVLYNSNLNKTTDYAARLVLSAPELKVDKIEDLQVDLDHSAIPLHAVCTAFFPFIQFHLRRYFENEFSGVNKYPAISSKTGEIEYIEIEDYQIAFSDTVIKSELELFQHGFSDRFRPIRIPTKNKKDEIYMHFKGYNTKDENYDPNNPGVMPIVERRLTWLDLIYQAAVDVVKDKHVLITRYPMDSYFNEFPTKVNVLSTKETEPIVINNTLYKNYPKIREKDINTNTSNKFVDTMNIHNSYLKGIGGDYDGDQATIKGVWSTEANAELSEQLNSKKHFIGLDGKNIRVGSNEALQCLYSLTLILPDSKHETPVF